MIETFKNQSTTFRIIRSNYEIRIFINTIVKWYSIKNSTIWRLEYQYILFSYYIPVNLYILLTNLRRNKRFNTDETMKGIEEPKLIFNTKSIKRIKNYTKHIHLHSKLLFIIIILLPKSPIFNYINFTLNENHRLFSFNFWYKYSFF